jgi:hypothetical protein
MILGEASRPRRLIRSGVYLQMEIILKGTTCIYNSFIDRVIFRFVHEVAKSEIKKKNPVFKNNTSCTVTIAVTGHTEKFKGLFPSLKFQALYTGIL